MFNNEHDIQFSVFNLTRKNLMIYDSSIYSVFTPWLGAICMWDNSADGKLNIDMSCTMLIFNT